MKFVLPFVYQQDYGYVFNRFQDYVMQALTPLSVGEEAVDAYAVPHYGTEVSVDPLRDKCARRHMPDHTGDYAGGHYQRPIVIPLR